MSSTTSQHLCECGAALLLCAALTVPAQAQTSEFNSQPVRQMLAAGASEQAYQTLITREDDFAGDPTFDYLLGLAALESGRADAATFAFERVLTVDPNFFGARVDMARAYFTLGNDDLARDEFIALKQLNPPASAVHMIDRYLDAIKARNDTTRVSYFAEIEFGYDTNANAATNQATVFIPSLSASVALDSSSSSTEDTFARGRLGARVAHKWDNSTRLRAGLTTDYHDFVTTNGFETLDISADAGVDFISGAELLKFGLRGQYVKLDWDEYQSVAGASAEWQYTWNQATQTALFAQHNRIRYLQPDDATNDGNLNLLGARITHALDERGQTLVSINAFAGVEAERNTRTDGSREIFGARFSAQHSFSATLSASASAGLQYNIYDRTNTLFNVRRRDEQVDFSVSMNWIVAPSWSVRPRMNLRRNISNVRLNAYERAEVGITLRRDF